MRGIICVSALFYNTAASLSKEFKNDEIFFLAGEQIAKKFKKEYGVPKNKILIDPQSTLQKDYFPKGFSDPNVLSDFHSEFSDEFSSRLIIADRRIGNGYVSGGVSRPDSITKIIRKIKYNYDPFLFPWLSKKYQELLSINPDFIFFYTMSSGPYLLLSEMAKNRRIVPITLVHSRVGNRMFFDNNNNGLADFIHNKESPSVNKNNAPLAKSTIMFKAPDYVKGHEITPSNETRILLKKLMALFYHMATTPLADKLEAILRDAYYMGCAIKRIAFTFKKSPALEIDKRLKYFFFPLHVDPESSTMVVSPLLTDQTWIIEQISKSLPENSRLLVKEHLPMVGRRPSNFYNRIQKIPKVSLVSHTIPSKQLIDCTDVTITITGSAALEATQRGKSAVVLAKTPFSKNFEQVWDGNIFSLSTLLSEAIQYKPKQDILDDYMEAVRKHSFPIEDSTLWGQKNSTGKKKLAQQARLLKKGITTAVDLHRKTVKN